jgi:hypothetical protein
VHNAIAHANQPDHRLTGVDISASFSLMREVDRNDHEEWPQIV